MEERYKLYNDDCLDIMDRLIEEGIIFDAIITDPPYGTTSCKWDSIIPFDEMWKRINKLIKPNGAIVLFGSEPFSSALRMSNIKNYKYDWIWVKEQGTGHLNCKIMPLKKHENISVFCSKKTIYNPQFAKGKPYIWESNTEGKNTDKVYGKQIARYRNENDGRRYPTSILEFNRELKNRYHSTQKPILLMEYLIKTYTNENELILDFTMGSGSTGVAALNTGRRFVGIEKDEKYFEISKRRLELINKGEMND